MGDMWLALDPLLSDGNGGLIVWAVSEAHGAQSGSRSTDGGQSQPQPVAHKLLFQCLAKKIDTVVQSLPGFASREVSETLAAVQREAVVFPPFFCWGCALLLLPMYYPSLPSAPPSRVVCREDSSRDLHIIGLSAACRPHLLARTCRSCKNSNSTPGSDCSVLQLQHASKYLPASPDKKVNARAVTKADNIVRT